MDLISSVRAVQRAIGLLRLPRRPVPQVRARRRLPRRQYDDGRHVSLNTRPVVTRFEAEGEKNLNKGEKWDKPSMNLGRRISIGAPVFRCYASSKPRPGPYSMPLIYGMGLRRHGSCGDEFWIRNKPRLERLVFILLSRDIR